MPFPADLFAVRGGSHRSSRPASRLRDVGAAPAPLPSARSIRLGPGPANGRGPAAAPIKAVEDSFLLLLRCPRTGGELERAGAETLAELNDSARKGELADTSGHKVEGPLEAALVSACGRWLYPVREGIPMLLVDQAIKAASAKDTE